MAGEKQEIVVAPSTALAHAAPFFTQEQERIILNTFLGGASKEEAQVLLTTVARRRLDPFSRQVYFVKRWDNVKREEVWAIQTSIDGLRAIAERTGKYDGQDEPVWGDENGETFCKVRVYRKDWSAGRAAVGIAYASEFVQRKKDGEPTQFWARMPRHMLAKCAEALAIRKAFPEDTGGIYIPEEMPDHEADPNALPPPLPASAAEPVRAKPKPLEAVHTGPTPWEQILAAAAAVGWTDRVAIGRLVKEVTGIATSGGLRQEHVEVVARRIKEEASGLGGGGSEPPEPPEPGSDG